MSFLQWLWAFAILAGYTDATEDPIWTSKDLDDEGNEREGFIFFATTRPVTSEEHIILLESYGWRRIEPNKENEWTGSLFRHDGW